MQRRGSTVTTTTYTLVLKVFNALIILITIIGSNYVISSFQLFGLSSKFWNIVYGFWNYNFICS